MRVVVPTVCLLVAAQAVAMEYPCPADPGFCYRDVADDGCFDPGTDEGPIDAELLSSSTFDPAPPPGSIICPPSVQKLEAPSTMLIATPSGSSIRIYGKPRISPGLELRSGGEILLAGRVSLPGLAPGNQRVYLDAEETIWLEASTRPTGFANGVARPQVRATSVNGDVVVGPKNKIKAGRVTLEAPAGSVTILDGVNFHDQGVAIHAGGTVLTKDLRMRDDLGVAGAQVELAGTTAVRKGNVSVRALVGDVLIDRLIAGGDVVLTGEDVTLGRAVLGPPRPSRMRDRFVRISATGAIQITNFAQSPDLNSLIETTGTSISMLFSKVKGKGSTLPDYEIIAGPGSVCDLTGSSFRKIELAVSCDTVVGP